MLFEFDEDKRKNNIQIHQFFKDKVFTGLDNQPLNRKVYRGKRDENGKRNNEVFYVNDNQDFRIAEGTLIEYVEQILNSLTELESIDVVDKSADSRKDNLEIHEKLLLKNNPSVEEYIVFVSDFLSKCDSQNYLNNYVKRKLNEGNFKDIIEKIEVFETGIVCILNNGFEMSLTF